MSGYGLATDPLHAPCGDPRPPRPHRRRFAARAPEKKGSTDMCTLRRLASLLAITAFALALPASAHAGGAHLLRLYKVEKHVDLEGDAQYTVKCPNGDYATDGMWRVDQVDQDNDLPGNIKEYVAVYAAYPDSSDKSEYHFKLENLAGGDSQVK